MTTTTAALASFSFSVFFSLSSLNHLILKHKTCTDKRRKLAYTKKCFSASFREIVRVVHGVNFFNGEAIPKVTLTHFYGPYVVYLVQLPRGRTPPANGRKTHHSQVPIEIELWWSSGGEGFRLWIGFEAKVPWDPTKRNTSGFQLNSIRKKGWNSSKFNFRHLNKTFLRHTKKLPENILRALHMWRRRWPRFPFGVDKGSGPRLRWLMITGRVHFYADGGPHPPSCLP